MTGSGPDRRKTPRPNSTARALLAILLVGAFLRFFELPRFPPALHLDEAFNGINALQVIEQHDIKVFYPENSGREGLFINAQALAVWLFGIKAWPLRLVSGIVGLLTVLGLFFLVRELFLTADPWNGNDAPWAGDGHPPHADATRLALVSAFFLSSGFWPVLMSRLGFRAISAPMWAVWAFYLMLAGGRQFAAAGGSASGGPLRPLWRGPLLTGVVFGLGFHSYIAYRVMPALAGLLLAAQGLRARGQGRMRLFVPYAAAVVAGSVIALAPLLVYFAHHPHELVGRAGQISVFRSKTPALDLAGNLVKTAGMFNVVGDTNPRHNLTGRPWLAALAGWAGASAEYQRLIGNLGRPELFWPVGLFFLGGLSIALRRMTFQGLFLLSWLVIAALPAVISNEDLPHALRSVLMMPPVFTLAAMGAVRAYDVLAGRCDALSAGMRARAALRAACWLVAALLVGHTYVTYFNVWGPAPLTAERFDKALNDKADALRALPPDLPKYVIVRPGALGVAILQYLTDSYTEEGQKRRHIRYVEPGTFDLRQIPAGAFVTELK